MAVIIVRRRRALIALTLIISIVVGAFATVVAAFGAPDSVARELLELIAGLLLMATIGLLLFAIIVLRANIQLDRALARAASDSDTDAASRDLGPLGQRIAHYTRRIRRISHMRAARMAVQRALLDTILANVSEPVLVTSTAGRVLYRSTAAARWSETEAIENVETEPPVRSVVRSLMFSDAPAEVRINDKPAYAHAIRGPLVFEDRYGDSGSTEMKDAVVYVLFLAAPVQHISVARANLSGTRLPRKRSIFSSWFRQRPRN